MSNAKVLTKIITMTWFMSLVEQTINRSRLKSNHEKNEKPQLSNRAVPPLSHQASDTSTPNIGATL